MTTLNEIKKHHPCKDSWEKLLASLGKTKADDEPLSFKHILESNGIEDAVWALRVLPLKNQLLFCADVVESVLHIFESQYPNENRPRRAVEALRLFARGEISKKNLRAAADDAMSAADSIYTDLGAVHAVNTAALAAYSASQSAFTPAIFYKWKGIEQIFIKHFCRK